MAFWRRIWQRDADAAPAACTALDVGTEFAKALVFEIDEHDHGTVRGVGRKRQGLSHMQSGTVADIAAVVDNCAVALQEAEEMAGFRPTQVVIGIAGELVKGFTTTHSQERKRPDQPITEAAIRTTLRDDLYILLAGWDGSGDSVTLKVFVNPLVAWIWIGGLGILLGTVISAWTPGLRMPVSERIILRGGEVTGD